MKRDVLLVVLLVAIGALVVIVLRQRNEIGELRTAQQPVPKPVVHAPPPPPREEPAPEPKPVASTPLGPVAMQDGNSPTNFLGGWAKMMKDPAMKEIIRVQQKMVIDQMYGGFFKDLNWPPKELDALKELLQERQIALMEAGMSALSGSEAERKQAAEQTNALKAEYDKKLKDLLGAQGYELFQQYEQTAPERVQVQMFKGALPGDVALTEQQEYDLIAAMHEERRTVATSSLINNQNRIPNASEVTEERIAEALKQLEQLQQRYVERAAAILTPEQLEHFSKWQQQMSAMQAAGMKMAPKMFGSKGASQSPPGGQTQTP